MWVKICGIRSAEDALAAVQAGADHLGVVLAPSPRRVPPEHARAIARTARPRARLVGVFVDATAEEVEACAHLIPLDVVQLHGGEDPAAAEALRRACGLPIWKALPPGTCGEEMGRWQGVVEALLLDMRCGSRDLSGEAGDPWANRPEGRRLGIPVILAGGLTPETVGEVVRRHRPEGVDVSRGVEMASGRKDPDRMGEFVRRARAALGEGSE